MSSTKKKESIGRQKIPIVMIKKENHRQVTFSKRKAGLFKKASELCTLCGAEVGIIVFSPAKKPFSFGHPSVESVLDRYLSRNNLSLAQSQQLQGNNPGASCELNIRLTQTLSELEEEKKKGQAMEEMRKANESRSLINWWERPVEEMNMTQLQEMKSALEELRKTVVSEANTAPFTDVKEDVFGFLNNKVMTAPSYMNMSSGLSSVYNYGNVQATLMADSNIVRNGDFSAGIEPWYPNGCEAFVVSSDPFSSDSISDSPSCGYACRIPKLFAKVSPSIL
ncbi:unnamed protein product [Microthlaspi erraticum]|uniref:MADS-box domain-containing protein n=1 Tax=Microthlaspi erraticum TaxID=1685480 RepID=A0A6D2J0E8_9BRAS|nr:unnamed protein product [Microthlaspi erraticum]